MEFHHISVLLNEVLDGLNIKENGIYVDGTLGGAGHSSEIVKRLSSKGCLIGIDQDTNALKASKERLKEYTNVKYVHSNFSSIKDVLKDLSIEKVDGILLDLGVSSHQLDEAERGFSYMQDAPLDMRMNRDVSFSAKNVVNEYSKEELQRIISEFGEDRWASRIAQFIVKAREEKEIETTFELVDIIKAAIPASARREGPHPAKRTFQAIRIEVNRELEILEKAIEKSVKLLNSGGRLCIITFHSLEDRIVKNKFKELAKACKCAPEVPICVCGGKQEYKILTKKPIVPSKEELDFNNRSHSSKLRVLEKI